MKFSELNTKTQKAVPKDETATNAKLLIRGGFIHKEMAGVYDYLPLGLRVLNNIAGIIREEMNALGAVEVLLSSLQNPETWRATNRWDDAAVDNWFKTKLKNDTELGLATTHEEPLAALLRRHLHSHKDLPAYMYQFQTKFRNELRAKSGILRCREFIMKDLYSFTHDEKELDWFYERAKQAYTRIFKRLGIGKQTYLTFASGGTFSRFSHEFQTLCEAGEDTIYVHEEKKIAVNREVFTDDVLRELGVKKEELVEKMAIEVGNVFKLGTKFSEPLGFFYTDKRGKKYPIVMGSYGIGPGRVMGTIVELFHDEHGILWPESVAPFRVHLIGIVYRDSRIEKKVKAVYDKLQNTGVETLYDDRDGAPPGEKFADADLIGIPFRLIVSEKTGAKIEVKRRSEKNSRLVTMTQLLHLLK